LIFHLLMNYGCAVEAAVTPLGSILENDTVMGLMEHFQVHPAQGTPLLPFLSKRDCCEEADNSTSHQNH
jgi:hypothetical protein